MLRSKICMGIALAGALVLAASPAFASSGGTVVSIPPTGQNGHLAGVSADSDSDAWAVGGVSRAAGAAPGPLIDHWNGTSWQQSATPSFASNAAISLAAVSASSTGDAWAVGYSSVSKHPLGLTLHWNGTAWATVPAFSYVYENALVGVADISSGNAYAAGDSSSTASGFIEHWNGTSWSLLTLPDPNNGMNTYLNAISASSASNVWAVGYELVGTSAANERYQTYSLHWNGSAWAIVGMPLITSSDHLLDYVFNSIDAISPTNVWAVGDIGDNVDVGGTPTSTVIEHYNGTSWSIVASPSPGTAPTLTGVTTTSATNVTAVGYDTPAGATGPQTLTLNWNGSAWTTVPSPNVGSSSLLTSVSTTPGAAITWAVGYSGVSGSFNPLAIESP
jgi:hypothetical protein